MLMSLPPASQTLELCEGDGEEPASSPGTTASNQAIHEEAQGVAVSDQTLTLESQQVKDDGSGVSLQDQAQRPANLPEMETIASIFQMSNDEGILPPGVLEGILKVSFPAPDLSSSLHFLVAKYAILVKEYQKRCSEVGDLETQIENLRKKCREECEPKYEALLKKYTEVWSERKQLYNEVIELKGNIRVFCRCRPLSSDEISKGYSSVFEFDLSQDMELQIITSENSRKQYKFDHVFGPQDNQEAVFAETMPIVKSVLDGYNSCIFAYGQTGTGKTFTMEGTPQSRGVNYRTLEELFRISEARGSVMRYEFFVSMLEVYNEKIRDLLAENSNQPMKKLELKQAAEGTLEVPGLVEAQANSTNGVWELLKTGARNRSVGSTNANELSSRSHSLVRVTVKGENLMNGQRHRSFLWLVDLAGSERLGKVEVEGEKLKESQFINKSLSALGDVIAALVSKNPHIPYRNSKLTHLLQSSLGGDCKTLMVVQISPSSADLGETLSSLNFATRVRGIEQGPARKQSDPTESFKCKQMAEKFRQAEKKVAKLDESLQLMQLKYVSRENVFKNLQEKVRDLESQLANERKSRIQQETKDSSRDLERQLANERKSRIQQETKDSSRYYNKLQQQFRDLESQLADKRKSRVQQETKDSTTYHYKPPLPPIKQRQPLGRINDNLPPSATRKSITTTPPAPEDKENISVVQARGDNMGPIKPLMKARRISLAPVVRPAVMQVKRRASIAVMPGQTFATMPSEARTQQNISNGHTSVLKIPRGRSIMSFAPNTSLAAVNTPDGKGKANSITGMSKFFSPTQMQQAPWKSKIPTVASPRQRLRFISSPVNQSSTSRKTTKLCFSVHKRLVISSPVQPQSMALRETSMNQSLRDKEIVRKLGTAQRMLPKNRRKSVM